MIDAIVVTNTSGKRILINLNYIIRVNESKNGIFIYMSDCIYEEIPIKFDEFLSQVGKENGT
jgi:hypothetical protein